MGLLNQIEVPVVDSLPTQGQGGYAPGTLICLKKQGGGTAELFINIGTAKSCLFVPQGGAQAIPGSWAIIDGQEQVASVGSDNNDPMLTRERILAIDGTTDLFFATLYESDDSDQILSVLPTQTAIAAGGTVTVTRSDTDTAGDHYTAWAHFRKGGTPVFDIIKAGIATFTTTDTTQTLSLPGVVGTDLVLAYHHTGATVTLDKAYADTNAIEVVMSADPTAHKVNYAVMRRRDRNSVGVAPSHYVYAAGVHTCVADTGAPYTNSVTIAGALATDVALANIRTNSGTVQLLLAASAAGALNLTFSANPTTGTLVSYALLRAI